MVEGASPILDVETLQRRTMGSEPLQIEILSLFATEAERLLRQASEAADEETRGDRLSALSSLARGIGASRLADAAARGRRENGEGTALPAVEAALREVLHTIASSPKGSAPSA